MATDPAEALQIKKLGTIPLSDERDAQMILQSSILGLWEVVNNLTRLRRTHSCDYRVTIFGSARCLPGSVPYEETRRVAEALARMGCDIITGGGPGIMQAANEGAVDAGEPGSDRSVGIRIDLPFEQGANAFVKMAYNHRTFFTRLHHFAIASNAFIVAPGGIGTLLEMTMVWQLLQVGHLENDVPLILMGSMWPELIEWANRNMVNGEVAMASPVDMTRPVCAPNAESAIEIIREHRGRWLEKYCDLPLSELRPVEPADSATTTAENHATDSNK